MAFWHCRGMTKKKFTVRLDEDFIAEVKTDAATKRITLEHWTLLAFQLFLKRTNPPMARAKELRGAKR